MPATVTRRQEAVKRRFPVWTPRKLDQAFDFAALTCPSREYFVTPAGSLTSAQVKRRSERIAAGLRDLGVRRGDYVAVALANFPDFVALKYAIARVGATCVPVNFLDKRDELGYVLRQSDAALLVAMDRFRGLDYLKALDELAPDWEQAGGGEALPRLRGGRGVSRLRRTSARGSDAFLRAERGDHAFRWLARRRSRLGL